jgi:hypothetical protein
MSPVTTTVTPDYQRETEMKNVTVRLAIAATGLMAVLLSGGAAFKMG